MKDISLYHFKDYKSYIKAWIKSRPRHGHGEKRKIAEMTGCHSAYVSQVLEHEAHFSLEQAMAFSEYVGHLEA